MRVRTALVLLLAAAGMAGCGGEDDGPVSPKKYAQTVDRVCGDLRKSVLGLQSEFSTATGTTDRADAVQAIGRALDRLAGAFEDSEQLLRDTQPPATYARYNAETADGFGSAVTKLRRVAEAARDGDRSILDDVGAALAVDLPPTPKALLVDAPKCAEAL